MGWREALTDLQRSTVVMAVVWRSRIAWPSGSATGARARRSRYGQTHPGDGALEVALAAEGAVDLVKLATKLKFETTAISRVETSSGAEISIRSEPTIEINVDGELIGLKTPATFGVVAKTRLLVPPPSGS